MWFPLEITDKFRKLEEDLWVVVAKMEVEEIFLLLSGGIVL